MVRMRRIGVGDHVILDNVVRKLLRRVSLDIVTKVDKRRTIIPARTRLVVLACDDNIRHVLQAVGSFYPAENADIEPDYVELIHESLVIQSDLAGVAGFP